jgi:hypothetical protein
VHRSDVAELARLAADPRSVDEVTRAIQSGAAALPAALVRSVARSAEAKLVEERCEAALQRLGIACAKAAEGACSLPAPRAVAGAHAWLLARQSRPTMCT